MRLTGSPRGGAAFLLGWALGGSLIAVLLYSRAEDAFANSRTASDNLIRLTLESSFDEARSAFWIALAVGVMLPVLLLAARFALLAAMNGARASKSLPK